MKTPSYAILIFMFALLSSARAADDRPAQTPYYPLKIGNTWTYKAGEDRLILKVVKFEDFEDQRCARIETTLGTDVIRVEHMAVIEDGVYRFSLEGRSFRPAAKIMALPFAKDQKWHVKSTVGSVVVDGKFRSGIVDEVTVPAGTFKDVHTVTSDQDNVGHSVAGGMTIGVKLSQTFFYAKDVGVIKMVVVSWGQRDVVYEMEKFEPGK